MSSLALRQRAKKTALKALPTPRGGVQFGEGNPRTASRVATEKVFGQDPMCYVDWLTRPVISTCQHRFSDGWFIRGSSFVSCPFAIPIRVHSRLLFRADRPQPPTKSDEQETPVFKEFGWFTFGRMSEELANPTQRKQ